MLCIFSISRSWILNSILCCSQCGWYQNDSTQNCANIILSNEHGSHACCPWNSTGQPSETCANKLGCRSRTRTPLEIPKGKVVRPHKLRTLTRTSPHCYGYTSHKLECLTFRDNIRINVIVCTFLDILDIIIHQAAVDPHVPTRIALERVLFKCVNINTIISVVFCVSNFVCVCWRIKCELLSCRCVTTTAT